MKKKFREERGSYRAVIASLRGCSDASSLCLPRVACNRNCIASGTRLVKYWQTLHPLDAHFAPAPLDPADSIVMDALVRGMQRPFLFMESHHASRVILLTSNPQSLIHLDKFLVENLFLICSFVYGQIMSAAASVKEPLPMIFVIMIPLWECNWLVESW